MPLRRKLIVAAGLVLVAVPAALAAYTAIAEARFFRDHPPPGALHDVGGRRLHINCQGAGTPAVIFESGIGGSSVDWYAVQPEVARFTRACAYDRAGAGWSDEASLPRDPSRSAEDLHALLAAAGVGGPYVLVGHSYGGYVARVFAHRYRVDMAGLVLVDSVSPEMFGRVPAMEAHWRPAARDCRWDKLRAIFAITRLRGDTVYYAPQAVRPLADGFYLARKLQDDSCGEIQAMVGEGQAQVRAAGSFETLPLAIVAAGRGSLDAESSRVWAEIQRELARLSSRSTHVIAEKSDHHIQFAEPEAIVNAVRGVIATARDQPSPPSRH